MVSCAALLAIVGFVVSLNVKIGDLDPGAPELRSNSRYNLDNAYITAHYGLSSDVFAVFVQSPVGKAMSYESLTEMDRLSWEIRQLPSVQTTIAATDYIMQITMGTSEGNPKWYTISRNKRALNFGATMTTQNSPELCNYQGISHADQYLSDGSQGGNTRQRGENS